MGKKKDAAKGEKVKLPKRVAGVKLPKELRQRGEALIAQAQTDDGRAKILQGVSIVAGLAASAAQAAAQSAANRSAAAKGAPSGVRPEAAANDPAAPAPGDAFAKTVTAGIDAALGRLFARK